MESSLACLDLVKTKKRLRDLAGDELFSIVQPYNVTSRDFPHAAYTRVIHSLRISLVSGNFHLDGFFPRIAALCKRLPVGGFPNHYNLVLSKSRVNRNLFLHNHMNFIKYHTVTLFLKWLLI